MRVILEQSAKNTIMKKFIAFLLIIALTMVNFILLGMEIVSYAANAIMEGTVTNNRNITFDTYFKDINGNKVTDKSESIDSNDMKLYIQLAVRNEGYFNGTVTLGTANFKLKNEVLSNYINKIEGNTVTLNQINSGETVELELGIEVIKEDTIGSGLLNMESEISVNGTYRDSTEKDINISATRKVKLELVSPYEGTEGTELRSSVLTNKVYEVNGKNKRIVQVLVESGLDGNRYPVKENMIEVSVPNGVEEVEVMARGMLATNGQEEIEFGKKDWEYSEKEQKVKIDIKNEVKNGTIKWLKNGKDRIVVTYVMSEETNITGKDIVATSKITMYDAEGTVKEGSQSVKVLEELDGVIGAEIEVGEDSIYKGKIYSGENREYNETVKIYANTNKAGKKVEVETGEATYEVAEGEAKGNIQILKTVINKAKVMRILGTEGSLTIKAGENIVKTINNDTETDENGNVVINYAEGTKTIKVETTEAKEAGTIELNNTKVIKQDENSKELKRAYTGIKERATGAERRIELKETETKAEIVVNKERLSALSKNENVEITATLRTDSEKYDLFKNPTFEIVMPESIKEMNIKTLQPLYADMFRVAEATITDGENGTRIIRVALEGEQTSHTTEVNQTTIVMVADIEFEELTPSKETAITMNYTNENGVTGSYREEKGIKVESKYGLMMNTTMEGFNDEGETIATMDDEVAKGKLEVKSSEKTSTVKEVLINNYDETMEDVNIIGRIPTEGISEGTINTELTRNVRINTAGAEVLYSKDANAKVEDSTWEENSEGAKAFKIRLGNLEKGAKVNAEYDFTIPGDLNYGEKAYSKVETIYTYLGKRMEQTSTVGAETEKLTGVEKAELQETVSTELENGLIANIGTTTAGKELKDGDSVYEGQAIEYTVYITNKTGRDLNNVNISVEQENGNMYGLKDIEVYNEALYQDQETHIEHAYRELDTNSRNFGTIEKFEKEQTIRFTYEIVTSQVEANAQTQGKIKIEADDFEGTTLNTIANKIENAELKMNMRYVANEEVKLYYGQDANVCLNIENISNNELKNVQVKVNLPSGMYVENEFYFTNRLNSNKQEVIDDDRISNVKYNSEDNTITFEITNIKPGDEDKAEVYFVVKSKDFEAESKELMFLAEAMTKQEKIYYSNVMTKTMNNVAKGVQIKQESNIDENVVLEDGDEFTLTITATNGSDKDLVVGIIDELPACFGIQKVHIESSMNVDKSLNDEELVKEGLIELNEPLYKQEQIKIVLELKVNAYNAENIEKNTVSMRYSETGEDGYPYYSFELKDEKEFNVSINDISDEIEYVEINQTSDVENKSTLKDGQEITYTSKIKNISNGPVNIGIVDALPKGIEAKTVTIDGISTSDSIKNSDLLNIENYTLEKNQTAELKITANYNQIQALEEELTNIVTVNTPLDTVSSNAITYYADYELDEDEEEGEDNGSQPGINPSSDENETNIDTQKQKQEQEEKANVTYKLSGLAWLDANKNGQRESNEELLQGIEVKVIDEETGDFLRKNNKDVSTYTAKDGTYSFDLNRGNYIVVFMYDTNKYVVTQYSKQGVAQNRNSDVVSKNLQLNGNNYSVATTDTIKLISDDMNNVDMGLLENTKFDMELSKYVSEVTVRTSKGVNTYNYDNTELAKVEIHAKELENANVIIKYTIRVTNNGEIAGYVKDIADYMPSSLTFNSELNTDWYQSDKNLHNASLVNTKIEAGESKDVTLILTKNMTESNTGLVSNQAELMDVSNELSAKDLDSTPGNKAQGEDDLGKADVIISVKTGALVLYVGLVVAILVIMAIGALMINKKILKNDDIKVDIDF